MDVPKKASIPINNSSNIKFVWAKVPDNLTRHTVIVLYFDDNPQLILDFSDSHVQNGSSSFGFTNRVSGISQLTSRNSSSAIGAKIGLVPYDHDLELKFLGTLLEFAISNTNAKDRAKLLVSRLLRIKMGKYHAKNNNCHHYNKRVFEILKEEPECKENYKIEFEKQMADIENEDQEKVDDFISSSKKVLAGVGIAVTVAAAAIFGAAFSRG